MKFPRWQAIAALLLIAIGSLRIASSWRVFNHTIDEPDNLAAGMEYLSTGKYLYDNANPPLARVFAAAGPFLAGERFHPGPAAYSEGYRILGHDEHYDRVLALGRAGILPFFWIASAVVFLWGLRAGGPNAALIATLLFTTIPPVLAHSGVITTDAALCAFTGAAALAAPYWVERPTPRRSVLLGVLIGLACSSKFSAMVYLPPFLLLTLLWSRPRKGMIALVVAVAALVIWAAYGFSFARVDYLHVRLPAPRFFTGLHFQFVHNRVSQPAYVLGRRSADGFWYFFPVVLALKTPLALLALVAGALAAIRRLKGAARAALVFAAVILLVSMTSRLDLGVRYVLPAYIGFSVAAAAVVARARRQVAKIAAALLLTWHIASSALQHPDYLAYTNELAGSHPERYLADSDLDWGQDMKRLGTFLNRAGVTQLTFAPFNRTYAMAGHTLPALTPGERERPSPGWNAVSITIWKVFGYPAWPDRIPPQQRIGRSILLWYFP